MKVLISAYACEPGRGSEQEVGFRIMLAAAEVHDVWVLTRENSLPLLEDFLAGHPLRERIRLHGIDLHGRIRRLKYAGQTGLHIYYDAWQRRAAGYAAELDRRINFDLVHHATFATYWAQAGVSQLGKPFVWGPVGGGVEAPPRLLRELGAAGLREEALRQGVRRVAAWRSSHHATARSAMVALANNASTARRLRSKNVLLLPHALTVRVDGLGTPEVRGTEIAFVGRLIPWKAGRLAVRTLSHLRHQNVVLRIFGDGPDRERIARAVERWGLQDRVEFVGQLPRNQMLLQLRRCGVLLHPALHDESPIAVAEALTLGLPVVCLDHGGPAEVVRWWPEAHVALVSPSDPDTTARGLAAAVDAFLDEAPPVPGDPVPPVAAFEALLLDAYDRAVERAAT